MGPTTHGLSTRFWSGSRLAVSTGHTKHCPASRVSTHRRRSSRRSARSDRADSAHHHRRRINQTRRRPHPHHTDCLSTATVHYDDPAPAPAHRAGSPGRLLLDTDTINALINSGELAVDPKHTTTKLFTDTADHPACGGVLVNASKQVYDGSGWVAAQTQALRDNTTRQHVVYESVISYPSARTATKMVAQEAHNWQRCNGRSITTTATSYPAQTWFVATVDNHDGMLTALMNQEGARGWACQHALTARNNIVIDIEVCGADITHQATAIAKKVAQNVH